MDGIKAFRDFLKRTAPFLTEADCELFRPFLRRRSFGRKDFFLRKSRVCRSMGFVLSGAFRVFYESAGKEMNTHFILPGDFVAEFDSFLAQAPSRYSVQALEPSEVIAFDFGALQKAYEKSHAWERLGRLIAENAYRKSRERAEAFLFLDGEGRYLKAVREEPRLFERVPLYHIASYLGLERESLSRIRGKLAGKGAGKGAAPKRAPLRL